MPAVRHAFVDPKTDGTDTTRVRPSDWNAPLQYTDADGAPSGTDVVVKEVLQENRTYYVATTGSNSSGDGSASAPWATARFAYDYICANLDVNNHVVTISLASATWTSPIVLGYDGTQGNGDWVGGGTVFLDFNGGTLHVTGDHALVIGTLVNTFGIGNVTFRTTTSGNCINLYNRTYIYFDSGVVFGPTANLHIFADDQSYADIQYSNYSITGGATSHIYATKQALVILGGTITVTGSPAFPEGFVHVEGGASINSNATFPANTATGVRFTAITNGVIDTSTAGPNYFPGNSAGTTATGGQYV